MENKNATKRAYALLNVEKLLEFRHGLVDFYVNREQTTAVKNALERLDIAVFEAVRAEMENDEICKPYDYENEPLIVDIIESAQ